MRRAWVYLALVAVAVGLVFVLRHRKRAFVAAEVQLLQSDDSEEATQARKRLQRVGRSAVRPVCALLEHDDEEIRARAALTLANIGHAAAAGPLMQAARRGDSPAADALVFMKHPRSREARAWVYCCLADRHFEEFKLRLPTGERLPTSLAVEWREPRRFQPVTCQMDYYYSKVCGFSRLDWSDVLGELRYADHYYRQAIRHYALPEALIGRARVAALHGEHAEAAELYARALQQSPDDEAAREGQAEAQQLAELLPAMAAHLPSADHIERILTHPSWRTGDTTYYIALATFTRTGVRFFGIAPKLILFKQRRGELQKLSSISTYEPPASGRSGLVYPTYVELCITEPDRPASMVVIRPVEERGEPRLSHWGPIHELVLYRLKTDTLVEGVRFRSPRAPWIGDIDEDGDAEIVTWRWSAAAFVLSTRHIWPTVHSLVKGKYEDRTDQFPTLFADMAASMRASERDDDDRLDQSDLSQLARAYELLADAENAIETYQRLERECRAQADEREQALADMSPSQLQELQAMNKEILQLVQDSIASLRKAAETVRERRLELEAQQVTGATGEGAPATHREAQAE